jgi:hypothetical protein
MYLQSVQTPQTPVDIKSKRCVVLVDNRCNGLSLLSIKVTMSNLKPGEWDVVIFTSTKSKSFYIKSIEEATVVTHSMLDLTPFDIEVYNEILKDTAFWRKIDDLGYEQCLIIQDDGCVVRKGLETSPFADADYVGAPWVSCPGNQELENFSKTPNMVGNGGLSLRNVKQSLDICETSQNKNVLFNQRLQRIQEDVFFSREFQLRGARVPNAQGASHFSVEQVYNPTAFGFHKFWAYNDFTVVKDFFKDCL